MSLIWFGSLRFCRHVKSILKSWYLILKQKRDGDDNDGGSGFFPDLRVDDIGFS